MKKGWRSDAAYSLLNLYGFDETESLLKARKEEKLLNEIVEFLKDDDQPRGGLIALSLSKNPGSTWGHCRLVFQKAGT